MTAIGNALSAMQASMMRLNASASNIANIRSTGVMPGEGAGGDTSANPPASSSVSAYQPIYTVQSESAGGGTVATYAPTKPATLPSYDPSSSHANEAGMVAMPNVSFVSELTEQQMARLSFEANVKVIETAHKATGSLLESWA